MLLKPFVDDLNETFQLAISGGPLSLYTETHTALRKHLENGGAVEDLHELKSLPQDVHFLDTLVKFDLEDAIAALVLMHFDMRLLDESPFNCLNRAVRIRNLEIAKILVNGATESDRNRLDFDMLLHQALLSGSLAMVEFIVSGGGKLDRVRFGGVLHDCVRFAARESVQWLLSHGYDPNTLDESKSSPLFLLFEGPNNCSSSLKEIAQMLLDSEADVDLVNAAGLTPFLAACDFKHSTYGPMFLSATKNVDSTDRNGNSALHFCAKHGSISMINSLHASNANLNLMNASGNTPLHQAALSQVNTCSSRLYLTPIFSATRRISIAHDPWR